jgi:type I restriction enzyme R subunit
VQLLAQVQLDNALDPEDKVKKTVSDLLHQEVAAMNEENFIVRLHRQQVERFKDRNIWEQLSDLDKQELVRKVAGLPSELKTDDIESRQFDMIVLRMQLALIEGNRTSYELLRKRIIEIASLLEEKTTIPAVKAQLAYIAALQDTEFWEGMNLEILEDMRLRLRGLMPFLDKNKRTIVYTDFEDEVTGIRDEDVVDMPKMTGVQYEKKVKEYLRNHQDHLIIHKLRSNLPLTPKDLETLATTLAEIGEDDGESLLSSLLVRSGAPNLAWFVRSLVGLDRKAAQKAFGKYLSDQTLTPQQIRFIEMIIDQLTARGVMDASALYEAPFNGVHSGGPDELFGGKDKVIEGLFDELEGFQKSLEPSAL